MDFPTPLFIVIIVLVSLLCILIVALLIYWFRVRRRNTRHQNYSVTKVAVEKTSKNTRSQSETSQNTNNSSVVNNNNMKANLTNINNANHQPNSSRLIETYDFSPSTKRSATSGTTQNVLLKNYRRFFDEPMITVDNVTTNNRPIDQDNVDLDEETLTSFRNIAYADSDPDLFKSVNTSYDDDTITRNTDQYNIYVPEDALVVELDRSQRLLTDSRKSLTLSEQLLANSVSHYKLRREMAELIARDKIQENTVTFSEPYFFGGMFSDSTSSPTTNVSRTPSIFGERSINSSSIVNDDLEVIYRERTAL